MDLHVVTSALRKYSSSLTAWSGDTAEATSYVSRNLRLEWSDAMMFQTVVQVNEGVVSAVNDALARIKAVTDASAAELRAAATMYDGTDHGVATNMDRHYEAVGPPAQRYSDISHPAGDSVPEAPEGEATTPVPTPGGGGGSW